MGSPVCLALGQGAPCSVLVRVLSHGPRHMEGCEQHRHCPRLRCERAPAALAELPLSLPPFNSIFLHLQQESGLPHSCPPLRNCACEDLSCRSVKMIRCPLLQESVEIEVCRMSTHLHEAGNSFS